MLQNQQNLYEKSKSADELEYDLESLIIRVEEEQQKNLNLNHINLSLREQLDQATMINQKLSQEIHKVNNDWVRLREQLENREREWRDEEIVSCITQQHG